MNNIPQTELTRTGVRSITDANVQNKFEKQVLTDLLNLYNKSNLIEIELDNIQEIIDIESSYMKLSAIKVQTTLANFIQNHINSTATVKEKIIYPNNITGIDPQAPKIDLETFDVTIMPSWKESKVNIFDEVANKTFIPESLKVELLTTENPSILKIVDNDVYRAFDTKSDTVWLRKITTDNTVNEVLTTMNIYLPYDIVTTDMVNEIVIKPFPLNSLNIKEIKYSSTYDVSYTTALNELKQYDKNVLKDYNSFLDEENNECFNIRLNFKDTKIKVLTITLSQKNYIQYDNYRIFYLGARDIQVNLNKYQQQYSEFEYIVDFGTAASREISKIDYILNNPDVADSSNVRYEIYTLESNGAPTLVNQSLPFTTTYQKLKIKTKLLPTVDNNTPNLSKIKISYKNLA